MQSGHNKQTIFIATKSTYKWRAHYALKPARGLHYILFTQISVDARIQWYFKYLTKCKALQKLPSVWYYSI